MKGIKKKATRFIGMVCAAMLMASAMPTWVMGAETKQIDDGTIIF